VGAALGLCGAWLAVSAALAAVDKGSGDLLHISTIASLVLLNFCGCVAAAADGGARAVSMVSPLVLGLVLALYEVGIIDPRWFPSSGCPYPHGSNASSSSGPECGIQEWRKSEYGDCVLILLEVLFIISLLCSCPFGR